jgi:hypothetical protein
MTGISGGTIETVNTKGLTSHFNGTVGTTAVDIPSSAGGIIQSVLIDNINTDSTKSLEVSFDGGTTYKTITSASTLSYTIKGGLTQIKLRGAVASCDYEILMNRES